jgi:transposase InsO family protein
VTGLRLAALVGRHRATVYGVLRRHGVSRRRRGKRQTFKRFEWSQPGVLLHFDAYKAPKFDAPGHRVTGQRDQIRRPRGLGHTVVIAVQDDHSRLVYAELHSAENAANVSVTLRRGAAWMREQGLGGVEAVLSDNAKCYTGHQFARTLDELGARHIRIPPYTSRAGTASWNGSSAPSKTEWAHGRVWPNPATRDRALSSFNRWRPHSAAGGRPPITRVQQDRRQDS